MTLTNRLKSKTNRFDNCVTRRMSVEALKTGAWNLSRGFPDEAPPPEVALAAIDAITSGRVHDFTTATAPAPFQIGAVAALNLPDSYFADLRHSFERRREILCAYLERAQLRFQRPEGAYYILSDVRGAGRAYSQLTRELLENAKVAVVPGEAYHRERELADTVIRLTFSKSEETLHSAGEAIVRFFNRA